MINPMSRFKLKITGKILLILLGLSLLSLTFLSAVAVSNMANMGRYALESNASLGASAVGDSTDALQKQAREQLLTLAIDQAVISDALFEKVESETALVASYTADLWKRSDDFPGGRTYYQDEQPDTIYTASVSALAPGVTPDAVSTDLRLLSNLNSIFIPVFQTDHNLSQLYVGTESGITQIYPWTTDIPATFDARQREWYLRAKESRARGWTNTVIDAVSGKQKVTCFRPIFDEKHALIGVVGADVTTETINQKIIGTQVGKNGYAFLIDSKGNVIAHPRMQVSGRQWDEVFETGNLLNAKDPELKRIAMEMVDGMAGVGRCQLDGSDKFIAYAPISTTGWSIGIAMPIDEIVAPVQSTRERIDTATADFSDKINRQIRELLTTLIIASASIIIAVAGIAYLLARRITRPIIALNQGVQVIGQGDLDHRLVVTTGDEIQDLAGAFNKMAENLKVYIRDLQETTSAKERIESELRVATEIQTSMLPRLFPPFPDRKEFDLYATMQPAREVGGDFYDFFFISPTKLCLIIGDVCGKGIPAALFMAISKTLLRTEALHEPSPDRVLFNVNNTLYPDNEASMFFTGLCAVLDTESGELTIANGGHNPPLLCPSGGEFQYINLPKGLVVGAMPDTSYLSNTYTMRPHDTLVMYTDGVTEAMDSQGRLYSEARLLSCLNDLCGRNVFDIIHGVRADIETFAGGTEQSDDITMLVIEFNGSGKP
ncbi:MAG: SpoIIE family protein phosphatase [Dehalococcoidia bacterium]|nr:SpoIIE family protein phosphatase [Dehalococcoidia bacterium]